MSFLGAVVSPKAPDWDELLSAQRSEACLVTFVNPYAFWVAGERKDYLPLLLGFDFVLADGMLLAKGLSHLTGASFDRVSFDGNSAAPAVFRAAERHRLSLAIVGGEDGIAQHAAQVFSSQSGLQIVSTRNGFFSDDAALDAYCDELVQISPDVVLVGMGAPHQERFLVRLKAKGWSGVGFTCGGYLDQAAEGEIEYYPEWVNRMNLRAPFRLFREPRRLSKRYFVHYAPFYIAWLNTILFVERDG
jgi:N-acetylglucosaminyldiphosphoundecaprenol N-acetyl-beta-D-mannosaminyltransferase